MVNDPTTERSPIISSHPTNSEEPLPQRIPRRQKKTEGSQLSNSIESLPQLESTAEEIDYNSYLLISPRDFPRLQDSNTQTAEPNFIPEGLVIQFQNLQVPPQDTLLIAVRITESPSNETLTALIDTGAAVSLITSKVYQSINQIQHIIAALKELEKIYFQLSVLFQFP